MYFKVARFQWNRAGKHLKKAGDLLDDHPRLKRPLLGPEVMRATYRLLHRRLDKALDSPLDGKPPRLSAWDKLFTACWVGLGWRTG